MEFETVATETLVGGLNVIERKHCPPELYVHGNKSLVRTPCVSIVGSRDCTAAGKARAKRLARMLVRADVTVVSGLAKGIDTQAHTTAIEEGGRTIAVIGTPLDKTYPAENRDLQALVAKSHLVVSQFKIGSRVFPGNFIARNRTMALLSAATVIVEAGEKSGAISQGWEALRLGRQLYIAESLTSNPKLTWPGLMLSYGGSVLTTESFDQLIESIPRSDELDYVSI